MAATWVLWVPIWIGGGARADRQDQPGADGVRVSDDPFQCPRAAHRAADHRSHPGDPQRRQCGQIGVDLIADRDRRKP